MLKEENSWLLRIIMQGNNVTIKGSYEALLKQGQDLYKTINELNSKKESALINLGPEVAILSWGFLGYELIPNDNYAENYKKFMESQVKLSAKMAKDLQEPWEDDGDFNT